MLKKLFQSKPAYRMLVSRETGEPIKIVKVNPLRDEFVGINSGKKFKEVIVAERVTPSKETYLERAGGIWRRNP